MTTHVELTINGPVARICFKSEKGIQLMSASTRSQLSGVMDQLEKNDSCRVIVVEAEGRTFIAGADIKELSQLDADSAVVMARDAQQLLRRIDRHPAVSVAAIHAACAGGGFEVALACDMRMAATSAKIGLPETSLGLIPGWGGCVRATQIFGAATARRLILSGELFDGEEACRMGIVDSVHADDAFRDAVNKRVEILVALGPNACCAAKRLISAFAPGDIDTMLQEEAEAFAARYTTSEPNEGLHAFIEKRAANWG